MARRTVRITPEILAESKIDKEEYTQWVNDPRTKKYLMMVNDISLRPKVDPFNPLAPQVALAVEKQMEGALNAIDLLLNLDDPEITSGTATGEPAATWGSEEQI